MSTRWENVVTLARSLDESFSKGEVPDATAVARLARAVLDFQNDLSGAASSNGMPPRSQPPGSG
jgi:hypothetical protein